MLKDGFRYLAKKLSLNILDKIYMMLLAFNESWTGVVLNTEKGLTTSLLAFLPLPSSSFSVNSAKTSSFLWHPLPCRKQ